MAVILCLDSSSDICSVSICDGGTTLVCKASEKVRSHSDTITLLVQQCIEAAGVRYDDLDAVAVSGGPGSYTSLRIGASTAKGICYALDLPLIALDTLQIIAQQAINTATGSDIIVAILDARRMEVYERHFDAEGQQLTDTAPRIIGEDYLTELVGHIHLCGNGVEKAMTMLHGRNSITCYQEAGGAQWMAVLAEQAYLERELVDVVRWEPNYIKPVNIIKSKKKLL